MESSFLPWAWGHFRPESLRWVRGVQPQRSKALLCREGFLCLLHCLQCYCFGVNGKLEVREVSWNFRCWLVAWAGLIGAYASHVGNSDCSSPDLADLPQPGHFCHSSKGSHPAPSDPGCEVLYELPGDSKLQPFLWSVGLYSGNIPTPIPHSLPLRPRKQSLTAVPWFSLIQIH